MFPQSAHTGARAQRRRWLAAVAVALSVCVAGGCILFGRRAPAPVHPQGVRESELHELAIPPDVDYARTLDLGNGRRVYHSGRDLLYADGDRFYPIVVRGYPRLAGPSPSGQAVAFLEPAEFEMAANLYVFDIPALTLRRLTNHGEEGSTLTVKAAKWFDDQTVYYLEGYRYGTVSRGGDLWRVDLRSLSCRLVVRILDDRQGFQEVVEFEFVPGHKMIRYEVARYDEYGSEVRASRYCTLDGQPVP